MKSLIEMSATTPAPPLIHINIVVERNQYESLIEQLPMPLTASQTNENEYTLFYDSEDQS